MKKIKHLFWWLPVLFVFVGSLLLASINANAHPSNLEYPPDGSVNFGEAREVLLVFSSMKPSRNETEEPLIEDNRLFAQRSDDFQPMRSRRIIDEGVWITAEGTVRKMGGGWFIAVENVLHQLYLAPETYKIEKGFDIEEGAPAMIQGYFLSEEDEVTGVIAVCTIFLDGKEYRFREDDGTPMWRGRGSGGRRQNQ